jgi:hypothetical protein
VISWSHQRFLLPPHAKKHLSNVILRKVKCKSCTLVLALSTTHLGKVISSLGFNFLISKMEALDLELFFSSKFQICYFELCLFHI